MELSVKTKYDSGEMLVDIDIKDMNAVSLERFNVEEIKAMIEPQAKFILMHDRSNANDPEASLLSHALVYGADHTQPPTQGDDKEAVDSGCQS